tara:strand:+ start:4645 stop:5181 length:537 start_codon:yes stop_codon:yes gene_type:complete
MAMARAASFGTMYVAFACCCPPTIFALQEIALVAMRATAASLWVLWIDNDWALLLSLVISARVVYVGLSMLDDSATEARKRRELGEAGLALNGGSLKKSTQRNGSGYARVASGTDEEAGSCEEDADSIMSEAERDAIVAKARESVANHFLGAGGTVKGSFRFNLPSATGGSIVTGKAV